MKLLSLSTVVVCLSAMSLGAAIQVPTFFSDGMVLQQEVGARVWGFGEKDEAVRVEFAGQQLNAITGDDGKWMVDFKDLKANKEGQVLTISSGGEEKVIKDVLVGEVWIASGQSNMEWVLPRTDGVAEVKTAKDDLLRIYVSRNVTAVAPARDFAGSWKKTNPVNNAEFTAVGYQYAKILRETLDVPVGIIECAWGGKKVEAFTSDAAIRAIPEAKHLVDKKEKLVKAWNNIKGAKPAKKKNPELNTGLHSTIYNGMIAPITGYGARGVIWYQGESNCNPQDSLHYSELLYGMIKDWRAQWGSDLSFYYVQLANFGRKGKDPESWVVVQDEMRQLLDVADGVGMAVINDIGAENDIHPKNKKDVGARLSRWALHHDYGMKDVVVSGPLYKSHEVNGASVEVSFAHSDGMKAREDKEVGSFELQGADGRWHASLAVIRDGKVIVSNAAVKAPTNVRYAWKSNPTSANLVNGEGLPASCFMGK